ncbi:ABC transporter substrate-binding protein [Streptomyces sp. NPDC085932]|uniref:ABC transporter substrate-binding protein n=1 Tax=Streptomyces sp. NPDC085932 TaxID=3365741 RepID=UPI0037CECDDD
MTSLFDASHPQVPRRTAIGTIIAAASAVGVPLTACTPQLKKTDGSGGSGAATVRIGYVSPQTGPLAPFGEADSYVIDALRAHFEAKGARVGGKRVDVEIVVKDSRSDAKRAGDVAADLILRDKVHLVLVASTPDTTNPVADQCEAHGVPCISTVAPWQPYFFGRNGNLSKPFRWTYHFFWGLEDVQAVFRDMWKAIPTNKRIGALWPNDPDGNAWGDAKTGFPPFARKVGYSMADPGRYATGTQDFTAQISRYKSEGTDILIGVPVPPDFTTFWKQAAQQGFRPKVATVGKALLFPSTLQSLGELGENLGTEVWWSPRHPFHSSLTGESAEQLAKTYTEKFGKPWTQPIGFVHALFEVAVAALHNASAPDDRSGIASSLARLKLSTVVGPLDWTKGPAPGVAKTPLVGGQWRRRPDGQYDLVIVSNSEHPRIPAGGRMEALS